MEFERNCRSRPDPLGRLLHGKHMTYEFIPKDTTLEAYRVQIQALRRLGPEGRLKMMLECSDNLRELAIMGVRRRHPDYDDETVKYAVIRLMVGEEMFHKFMPGVNVKY